MQPAQTKLLLVSIAIIGSIVLLGLDGSRAATVYYQTIPELRATPASQARAARVTGYVVAGSIRQEAGKPLHFLMRDAEGAMTMPVVFDDLVPDTFKDGAEVVVEGGLAESGVFEATLLLAKCPSKYESEEKHPTGTKAARY